MGRNARLRKAKKEADRLADMGEMHGRLVRRLSHAQLAKKLGVRPQRGGAT